MNADIVQSTTAIVGAIVLVSLARQVLNPVRTKQSSGEQQESSSDGSSGRRVKVKRNRDMKGHKQTIPATLDPDVIRKGGSKGQFRAEGFNPENVPMQYFAMEEIGRIKSPFPHRAGTPRQGTLAPHARSFIQLHDWIPIDSLRDLGERAVVESIGFAAKVMPPRAGGKRVGVFSTRSPHRPNSVGLSLCKIESVDVKGRKVTVMGLDLVDGTPVYDLKPYIPWDSLPTEEIVVPAWVSQSDELAAVTWTESALEKLRELILDNKLTPLYRKPKSSPQWQEELEVRTKEVSEAISEVVSQDPRALHHGRGEPTDEVYTMTFSSLRVGFNIFKDGKAEIVECELDPGDITAPEGSYQHSLALRREAETKAKEDGKRVKWKYDLYEGMGTGVLEQI